MAENKKSFVAYCDWQETFEELSNEEAGKLVKHLFNYVNDKNPEASDKLTKMCFIPIKQSLKRDLKKYESYVNKQKANGSKGGRPKTQKTQAFILKPKKADSVSDSVSDSDSVNVSEIKDKSFTINNKSFILQGLKDKQWLEVLAMQNRNSLDMVKNKLTTFEGFLISTKKQHNNYKEFASHFTYWLAKNKQEINHDSNIAF